MVKVFESIAGRTGCAKVMFADVQAPFAASLPVLFLMAKRRKQSGGLLLMTSDNICDILVPEKKQQSLRHMKNYLITCEYGLSNAAGFERTCCVFAYLICDARNVEDKFVLGSFCAL